MRIALITNIPTPYRTPVFDVLAQRHGDDFCVFYCSGNEPDRHWQLEQGQHRRVFLKEKFITLNKRFIHLNTDTWQKLDVFQPSVIITTGFNPTHLMGFLYATWHGLPHICMTDGTLTSEAKLSTLHRWVRRMVFERSVSFIGPSTGSFDLYRSYRVAEQAIFKSHLCANNRAFLTSHAPQKTHDFIFCGRFTKVKNPLFAIEVARQTALLLGRKLSLLCVGSGDMENDMRQVALQAQDQLDTKFAGFADQSSLPRLYNMSRILLFPTLWDPWGVVANEACAAGLPVLITEQAGSAGDIVIDGFNGHVIPIDIQKWSQAAATLLSDAVLYDRMSSNSKTAVHQHTFEHAALGIQSAIDHATLNRQVM